MISVLIINYNTAQMVNRAVESILKQTGVEVKVLVLDNNSQDNSVEVLQSFANDIELVINKENVGFGKGVNTLFQQVTTPYIYLLNPDAWLKETNTLARLVDYMENNPQYGIVTTALEDEQGQKAFNPHGCTYIGERYIKHPLPELPGDISWVLGASLALPSDVFRQINGFDEDYFVYCEDIDLSIRVRKAGYPIAYLPDLVATHIGGGSEKNLVYAKRLKQQTSRYCFYRKHYHPQDAQRLINRDQRRAYRRALRYRLAFLCTRKARYHGYYLNSRAIIDAAK